MNLQISFLRRPALGALLMVLSAGVVPCLANSFTVRGSLGGHGIGVVQPPNLQAAASGSGSASQIGRFTYSLSAAVDLASGTSTGVFLLVFANGDVIYGTITGSGGPTEDPAVGHIMERLTITGGTGRFQDASGNLTLDRSVDQTTLPAYESHTGTMTGTISTPGSK